jgi:hypothetical protein
MFSEMIDVDDDEVLLMIEGMSAALIGECSTWDNGRRTTRLIYDASVMIRILMDRDEMTYDEAFEFISFNVEDAYVGLSTPIVMWPCEVLDDKDDPTH